jgi:hypothetical protein
MRAIATTLASWIASRPQEYVEIEFYEFRLSNGAVLRYTSYPGTIVLTDPPPPGGRSVITPQFLGGEAQVFGSPYSTKFATFGVPTVNGVTIVMLVTNPGETIGHIIPPVITDPTGQVTWNQRGGALGVVGNLAVLTYVASTTGAPVGIKFGDTDNQLGIVGRMSIYVIGIPTPEGGPALSFDSNASFPATNATDQSSGVNSISHLSTNSTYPLILAFNGDPDSNGFNWSANHTWSATHGLVNDAPSTADPGFAGTSQSIGLNYNAALGQLNDATVTPFSGAVSQNVMIIDAIANNTAPPAGRVTTWIGTDVQIIGDGDQNSGEPPIPGCKSTLSGTADQMPLQIGFWPANADAPQSEVGSTTWPSAIRNRLFKDAGFTLYRAYWRDVASLLAGTPPIGWGDVDQYGDPFNGLVNMFDGYVTKISGTDRISTKFTISDGRTRLAIDFPRYKFAANCRHVLYGTACGAIKASFTVTGTMGTPTANGFSFTSGKAAGYYALGAVTYTDPELGQITLSVASDTGTQITLTTPFPTIPAAGTAFSMSAGCDHSTGVNGCTKFARQSNYGGFLYVPPPRTVTG